MMGALNLRENSVLVEYRLNNTCRTAGFSVLNGEL